MARTTQITFSQVAQIADTMKAAGHRPTARALRERIGSGSMGTIHKLLQQYNGSASEERDVADLPDSIATALMDFLQTEVATACEPIQALLQESKEAAEALASENERLERLMQSLYAEIEDGQRLLAEEKGENKAMAEQLAITRNDFDQARRKLDSASIENGRQAEELHRLRDIADQAETTRQLAEQYSAAKQEAEKREAVMAAKLDAAIERASDRTARAEAAEKRAEATATEARTANQHYQACSARLEEAARTIDELKKKNQPATTKVTKPKTTAAKQNELAKN